MTGLADIIDIDIIAPPKLPNIGVYKILLHIAQFIFSFLVLCLSATVISAERTYYGSSQASVNYALVISLFTLFILVPLVLIPWTKFTYCPPKLREGFFIKARTNLIFNVFLALCWFVTMISLLVHISTASNCRLDSDLEESDPDYTKRWLNQCNCAKAAAAFGFLSFILWIITSIICAILFWYERKQEDSNSKTDTVIEEPSTKYEQEDTDTLASSYNGDMEKGQGFRSREIESSPVTNPMTLTSNYISPSAPYSPSVVNTPQVMTAPYVPQHNSNSPYLHSSEPVYQRDSYVHSPLAQQHYQNTSYNPSHQPYNVPDHYHSSPSQTNHELYHQPPYQPAPYNYS